MSYNYIPTSLSMFELWQFVVNMKYCINYSHVTCIFPCIFSKKVNHIFVLSLTATNHFLFFCGSSSDTHKADGEVQVCFSLCLMITMFTINRAALLFVQLLVMWDVFAGKEHICVWDSLFYRWSADRILYWMIVSFKL